MSIRNVKRIPVSAGARRATALTGILPENSSSPEQEVATGAPNPEVVEKPERRRFTAKYKLDILRQADACTEPGSLGALLRREGLNSSNLNTWRRQRDEGTLSALEPNIENARQKQCNRPDILYQPRHEADRYGNQADDL